MEEQYSIRLNNKNALSMAGSGFSYYDSLGRYEFDNSDEGAKAALIANIAYREGYNQAQRNIKKALGIKGEQNG